MACQPSQNLHGVWKGRKGNDEHCLGVSQFVSSGTSILTCETQILISGVDAVVGNIF